MVEYYYPQIYDSDGKEEIAEIRQDVNSIYDEYCMNSPSPNPTEPARALHGGIEASQCGGQPHHVGIGDYNNDRKRKLAEYLLQKSQQQPKKTDLDLYIETTTLPLDSDSQFDILDWWRTEGSKYPILSMVARDVLVIPISTVASESAFSTGERVIDAYRSRLALETVENLICTQDWIRGSSKGSVVSILRDIKEGLSANEDASTSQSESCAS